MEQQEHKAPAPFVTPGKKEEKKEKPPRKMLEPLSPNFPPLVDRQYTTILVSAPDANACYEFLNAKYNVYDYVKAEDLAARQDELTERLKYPVHPRCQLGSRWLEGIMVIPGGKLTGADIPAILDALIPGGDLYYNQATAEEKKQLEDAGYVEDPEGVWSPAES